MRAVFDSNIWISAFRFRGRPRELVQMAVEGEIDVAISQSIMDETLRVMREKFQATPEQLDDARNIMESCTRKVESITKLNVVKDDPKDNHIIECAVAVEADTIITGDKDLLRIGEYNGIKIMQVPEFLGQQRGR